MLGEAVRRGLRQQGHAVDWVRDAAAATAALDGEPYEVVLLDPLAFMARNPALVGGKLPTDPFYGMGAPASAKAA